MLAHRLRALIAQPARLFSTAAQLDYQPLEEPNLQLEDD